MNAPIISSNIWGDTEVTMSYWTVRYYHASGIGVEHEWTNVYAASAEDAKAYAQGDWRIIQGRMYCLYAFKQEARIF